MFEQPGQRMTGDKLHSRPDLGTGRWPCLRSTTQEVVLNTLREAIASGEFPPGARLHQDDLANQMGVSRVPVREALGVLMADGQLDYLPFKGYRVSRLSESEVEEINLMRDLLEGEAIRKAIPKVDDELIHELENLNESMRRANIQNNVPLFISLNYEFHFVIFGLAGLPRLRKHIDALWKSADPYRRAVFSSEKARSHMLAEHESLIEACAAGDVDGAVAVMNDHRNKAVTRLSTLVGDENEVVGGK